MRWITNDNGTIVACDMLMSTNQIVLKQDPNYTNDLDRSRSRVDGDGHHGCGHGPNGRCGSGRTFPTGWELYLGGLTNGIADPLDKHGNRGRRFDFSGVLLSALQYPSGGFHGGFKTTTFFVSQKLRQRQTAGSKAMLFCELGRQPPR